jgi:hypothetical protein
MNKKPPPKPITCYICFGEDSLLESTSINECACRFIVHEQCWEEAKRNQARKDQCLFCNKKYASRVPTPSAPVLIMIPDLPPTYQSLAAQPAIPQAPFQPTPFQKKLLMIALISGVFTVILFFLLRTL